MLVKFGYLQRHVDSMELYVSAGLMAQVDEVKYPASTFNGPA